MAQDAAMQKREAEITQAERTRAGQTYIPTVDIVEREGQLLLMADLPGVKADDLEINFEHGLLTVHGKVTPRQDPAQTDYLLQEYGVGDFYRRFEVGEGIDASKIEAELKDGVLTLHLPKAPEIMPRKIAVKAG